jgi:hypothetical protein
VNRNSAEGELGDNRVKRKSTPFAASPALAQEDR